MDRTTKVERSAAGVLVGALEEMLAELAGCASEGDLAWLRPLAVLSAEIEYSALRGATVDSTNLADECREVTALLTGRASEAEFAARYPAALMISPAITALQDRALAACRLVASRHAISRSVA
jgi:hypothetical protein